MAERFEKFTEGARGVLQYAQEEAQRFNHNYIGTEHLLLGLLRQGEGPAANSLSSLGVSLAQVRRAVEFIIGRGQRTVRGDIGLTPRAKRVIELSVEESRRLKDNIIRPEHLLLGLLREGEGIAVAIVESFGVQQSELRDDLKKRLTGWVAAPAAPSESRDVLTTNVDPVAGELLRLDDEASYRPVASGPGYECRLVHFMPRDPTGARQVIHADEDIVCEVVRGYGELHTANETRALAPGTVCRIPAGTAHEFAAGGEPLVLLYVSVSVG